MTVKLDIEAIIEYVSKDDKLKKRFNKLTDDLKKSYDKSFEAKGFYNDPIKRKFKAEEEALKTVNSKMKDLFSSYEKLNQKGGFSYLFDLYPDKFKRRRKDQKRLSKDDLTKFVLTQVPEDLKDLGAREKKAKKEEITEEETYQKYAHPSEEEQEELEEDRKYLKELKDLNKNSKGLDKILRNILKGKWAAVLGSTIAGAAVYAGYRIIRAGLRYAYQTSQQGLDWQRTISGGASGSSWFGKDIAGYQRAGIDASSVQGFKRGLQGYLGSVKLGMGNAAPLMYLGLSALGDPDQLEKQIEQRLRSIKDKSVSLALAQQMGMDYAMWEAIYTGKVDKTRAKEGYSKEAIEKWAAVADKFNDLITDFKVLFFNKGANIAYGIANPTTRSSLLTNLLSSVGYGGLSPVGAISSLVKFGTLEIIVKNEQGEVIGTAQTEPENTILQLGS